MNDTRAAETFDVIVAGLGAIGSATALALTGRGLRVLGIDRFHPPHDAGSSHGESRIIREAYFEDPRYVPIVQRAYDLWQELADETGLELLRPTTGLMIGPPDGTLVQGARHSAELHGLEYRMESAAEVRRRYPALRLRDEDVAVWEPRAGVLFPERCIEALLERAGAYGATLRFEEPLETWQASGGGVSLSTPRARYQARHLVLCLGAWTGPHSGLELPLTVTRQMLYWFGPRAHAERFDPAVFPIFIWEDEPGRYFYGFPDLGTGVKIARHHEGAPTDPDHLRRDLAPGEVEAMRAVLERFIPDACGPLRASAACMYTNTPDGHFLIDRHPAHREVILASPCSGHGFKFAPALGELIADMVVDTPVEFDIRLFGIDRLLRARA